MIREISHRNLKIKSRQKSKTPSRLSQSKGQKQSSQPLKIQATMQNQASCQSKVVKNQSKTKINKNITQVFKGSQNGNQKIETDNNALHMKANLKNLIRKNMGCKQKKSEVVPELMKNIQKHCKELKKIHQNQQKLFEKRGSLQVNKTEKDKRLSGGNKSYDYQCKKKKESLKESQQKQIGKPGYSRYSFQINPNQQKKSDIESLANEKNVNKLVQESDNNKNFVELFQIYKKNFDIEDFKVERSNKNTNYNTNQSKNSSSLFNSHRYSALGDHSSKNKMKNEDKINLDKIESLIKSQQSSISQNNSNSGNRHFEGRDSAQLSRVDENQENFKKTIQIESFQKDFDEKEANYQFSKNKQRKENDSLLIKEDCEIQMNMLESERFSKQLYSRKTSNLKSNKEKQQQVTEKPSIQNSAKKSSQLRREKQFLERQFQNSKYYVRPIPKPQPKAAQIEVEKEEDSLVGCEITLIENNVVIEDSELISLQL